MKIGHDLARQRGQPDVLHDGRIDARAVQQDELLLRRRELVGEDEDVERDVALHAMFVEKFHQAGQVVRREIGRAHARVEGGQPEVDRVRAVGHRRARAFPVARGREQLGFSAGRDGWSHRLIYYGNSPESGTELIST